MSSRYPILGNRTIDQWKVTELKEELKRRKLTTRGLKDDLIKRLDEAIRIEMENATKDNYDGLSLDPQPVTKETNAEGTEVVTGIAGDAAGNVANANKVVNNVPVQLDVNDSVEVIVQEKLQEEIIKGDISSSRLEEEPVVHATAVDMIGQEKPQEEIIAGDISSHKLEEEPRVHATPVQTSSTVTGGMISEVSSNVQGLSSSGTQEVDGSSQSENKNLKAQLDNESKPLLENEGLKCPHVDVTVESPAPTNQVSEVSPNLGFQVKSDSISTDSVSINEKIELKDNIIDDTVKLELDVVKTESVEPSPGNVVPVGGDSHPMDVEEPHEKKASIEEEDGNNATDADVSKKSDIIDIGDSEKLNLDRSSGDDSMEEDIMESKQIDSKDHSVDMGDRTDYSEAPALKEDNVNIVGKVIPTAQKEISTENIKHPILPSEKRKLHDQEFVGKMDTSKRQRRWNSESFKVPEPQSLDRTPTTTPKMAIQPPLRRNFSRSDSSASEDTPKERVVPPPQKPPTNSLRIDRFVRPFTLKAVQELLGKTGTVESFWMDQIKTHCYVTYASVDEAIETRNSVYNLQWPSNGGRLLVAEFVDPQEVKMRLEAPPQSAAAPLTPTAAAPAPPLAQLQPSPRQQVSRQQLPGPPPLPPPPPLSNPPLAKERLSHPLPLSPTEKYDPPIVTLDDLFRKTTATPRIYYLPLSEEQVAAKLAEQGQNTKQSAGTACKEIFQPGRGMWFVDAFWIFRGLHCI